MATAKSYKSAHLSGILFQVFLFLIAFSSVGQTKQSYRNHEEIEVGGGMKVEILKCTGEGPTEECDCIYFRDKRQNGTRMKQSADHLKEEERAAALAGNNNKPEIRKSRGTTGRDISGTGADKAIPASIVPKPKVPGAKPEVTLEEAVRHADSVAAANSKKIDATFSPADSSDDPALTSEVNIPKVNEAAGAKLEASATNVKLEGAAASGQNLPVVKEMPKEVMAQVNSSVPAKLIDVAKPASTTTPVLKKDSITTSPVANTVSTGSVTKTASPKKAVEAVPPTIQNSVSDVVAQGAPSAKKDTTVNTTVAATDVKPDTTAPKPTALQKDTPAKATSTDSVSAEAVDTAEHNWVKHYEGVKPTSGNLQQETDQKTRDQKGTLPPTDKLADEASDNTGSGVMSSPSLYGKGVRDDKTKNKQLASAPSYDTSTKPAKDVVSANAKGTNKDATSQPSQVDVAVTKPAKTNDHIANDAVTATPSKDSAPTTGNGNSSGAAINVIGKTAEVNSNGEWEKATIVDKETEFLYKVHYANTSADKDEWVAVTQIRNIDSTINTLHAPKPVKPAKTNVNCTFEAPAAPVLNGDKYSDKLAKRKIYDSYVVAKNANTSSKTGVTFLSFRSEAPYVNTVRVSEKSGLEVRLPIAPAGAMIYPVTTEFKVCEQVSGKTSSKTLKANYACFRNKEGSWTCAKID